MEKKVKKNNIEDFPSRKISDYGITPCDVIFNQVDKPLDYIDRKSVV